MCGKNSIGRSWTLKNWGSPPRVREKLETASSTFEFTGITPACAGKTQYANRPLDGKRDHPRVCGKNFYFVPFCFSFLGSPPRVREKHAIQPKWTHFNGITPACAGKTEMSGRAKQLYEDHPRVCGKN